LMSDGLVWSKRGASLQISKASDCSYTRHTNKL